MRVLSYHNSIIYSIVKYYCHVVKDIIRGGEKRPRKKTVILRRRRVPRRWLLATSGRTVVVTMVVTMSVTTATAAVTERLRGSDTAEHRRRRNVAWFRNPEDGTGSTRKRCDGDSRPVRCACARRNGPQLSAGTARRFAYYYYYYYPEARIRSDPFRRQHIVFGVKCSDDFQNYYCAIQNNIYCSVYCGRTNDTAEF